jgi:hypothetical protein
MILGNNAPFIRPVFLLMVLMARRLLATGSWRGDSHYRKLCRIARVSAADMRGPRRVTSLADAAEAKAPARRCSQP